MFIRIVHVFDVFLSVSGTFLWQISRSFWTYARFVWWAACCSEFLYTAPFAWYTGWCSGFLNWPVGTRAALRIICRPLSGNQPAFGRPGTGRRPAAGNLPTLSIFGRSCHQKMNLKKVVFFIRKYTFVILLPETCNFDVFWYILMYCTYFTHIIYSDP